MRAGFLVIFTALACARVLAQTAAPPLVQESQPLDPKSNQKIEHIHVEDKTVKIDERRYAGQTENITVQPKDGLPAYEILPPTQARQRVDDPRRGTATGGERVWNVFGF
jgi:hypothetical protein